MKVKEGGEEEEKDGDTDMAVQSDHLSRGKAMVDAPGCTQVHLEHLCEPLLGGEPP